MIKQIKLKNDWKAFGLLIRLAVKTGIRASDLLNLEYIQFKENREYPNTFTLEYSITKTKSKNIIPVGAELMRIIQVWTWMFKRIYKSHISTITQLVKITHVFGHPIK
jgi:integrase